MHEAAPGPNDAEQARREARQAQEVVARARFTVTNVCLVTLTGLAIFATLAAAAEIILPIVFGIILALLLSPAMRLLSGRLRLPRMLSATLLIAALFAAIGGVAYAISVPATTWIARAPQSLPKLQQKLGALREPIDLVRNGIDQMQRLMHAGAAEGAGPQGQAQPASKAPAQPAPAPAASSGGASLSTVGLTVLSGTRSVLGNVVTLVVVLFFLLIDGDNLLRRFVEILPSLAEKKRAVQIAEEVERNISAYLLTVTVMNLLVGIANGLSIWLFGLPDPLLWGTIAFLLNYIPVLGALTGIGIFFFVGLFSFPHLWMALLPSAVYLLIHIVEGETITPMLLARRFTLNPLLVILALMFWGWLWGVAGALLAVPLLAVTKILCDHITALTPVGHLLGAEPTRGRRR
jgi:predicted PurR-regulated permease PerM